MRIESQFLVSLVLTLLIEIPILIIFLRFLFKSKLHLIKVICAGIIASVLTLPYLWFIIPSFVNSSYYILISELLAVLIETLIYSYTLSLNLRKSFLISLFANLVSFLIGFYTLLK